MKLIDLSQKKSLPKSKTSIVPTASEENNSVGIVPLNLFRARSKVTKYAKLENSVGIVPIKALSLRSMIDMFGMFESSDGKGLEISLLPVNSLYLLIEKLAKKMKHAIFAT